MNSAKRTEHQGANQRPDTAGEYQLVEKLPMLGTQECICILRTSTGGRVACSEKEWETLLAAHSRPVQAAPMLVPGGVPAAHGTVTTKSSDAEKYALFRSLFRGREDVWAQRFWSSTTGKTGYAPVCTNRWNEALCTSPRRRCRDCPNRSCPELSDAVLRAHMIGVDPHGKDVVGIYPMLDDSTVWFLAADFDDGSWQKDAQAFCSACRAAGLTPAVERSQSGEGAHVWLFFEEPVQATYARRLGTGLLTSAMRLRHEISLTSYDRLFPSQDILPKGGFGNLIALPFQGRARASGNSLFVDDEWKPYEDQWLFLSSLPKISAEQMGELLVQFGAPELQIPTGASDAAPAPLHKTRSEAHTLNAADFPQTTGLVIRNGVFIPKDGLSQGAMTEIRRLAAFSNPEFFQRQRARLSVYNVPRAIDCADEDDKYILLPRGCLDRLTALIEKSGAAYTIEDERNGGQVAAAAFAGELRLDQSAALEDLLAHDTGVLAAATGFGKTVVSAAAIARRQVNTLVLVHTTTLLDQWKSALEKHLDFGGKSASDCIGQFGAGRDKRTGNIDIATIQSLVSGDERTVRLFVEEYGMVICDECHHVGAVNFERILKSVPAKYVYGLSATPDRADGLQPIVYMQCGPVRHKVDAKTHTESRGLSCIVIPRITHTCLQEENFQQQCSALAIDEDRNDLIVRDAAALLEEGRTPILLTRRREHAQLLAEELQKRTEGKVVLLMGGTRTKQMRVQMEELRSTPADMPLAVVATGQYAGEGFDEPRLDTILLAEPVAWKGVVSQYVGRLHRDYDGKEEVRVYDYVDICVPRLEAMYRKRVKAYTSMGYTLTADLRTNQAARVCGADEARTAFLEDVQNAAGEIVITCPFMEYARVKEFISACELAAKGLRVTIRMGEEGRRASRPRVQSLARSFCQSTGSDLEVRSGCGYCSAVIDGRIVWHGDVNFLGRKGTDALRLESVTTARELLEAQTGARTGHQMVLPIQQSAAKQNQPAVL